MLADRRGHGSDSTFVIIWVLLVVPISVVLIPGASCFLALRGRCPSTSRFMIYVLSMLAGVLSALAGACLTNSLVFTLHLYPLDPNSLYDQSWAAFWGLLLGAPVAVGIARAMSRPT